MGALIEKCKEWASLEKLTIRISRYSKKRKIGGEVRQIFQFI
jgi:hypothetical protein